MKQFVKLILHFTNETLRMVCAQQSAMYISIKQVGSSVSEIPV